MKSQDKRKGQLSKEFKKGKVVKTKLVSGFYYLLRDKIKLEHNFDIG